MDLQLTGRTALVTGASTGIGRAIAATLAAEGMKMAVVARRRELLESLGQEIVAAGGTKPAIIVADMMEAASPLRIRDEAMALLGKVSIPSLVIHGVDDPLVPQSAEAMSSA